VTAAAGAARRLTFYSDAEYFGGAEGYLCLLASYLDREQFDLSLILPACPGAGILEKEMRRLGVRIHHLDRPGFRWASRLGAMIRGLRAAGGETLHMNLPSSYDAGVSSIAWAARQAGYSRVVSTEHLPMIDRKYRKFPTKVFFSHWVDAVIVNTRSNREFLIRRHGLDPGKISVIDNGVEEVPPLSPAERAELRRDWGAEGPCAVIGIVGRLTRRKGHHFLLRAVSDMLDPGLPRWKLVIAGDGEEEETLRELARSLDLESRVVWLGHREDARRLMFAFDLLALPSTVETMPFAILEGMAASLPVVASAIYGIPELVVPGETGHPPPPADVPALRSALLDLLADPVRRARLGRAGRERFERRFTAARMARTTARVYRGEEGRGPLEEEVGAAVASPGILRSAGAAGAAGEAA